MLISLKKIIAITFTIFFLSLIGLLIFQLRTQKLLENISFTIENDHDSKIKTATLSASIKQLNKKIDTLTASSSTLLERIKKLEKQTTKAPIINKKNSYVFQKQIIYLGSASTSSLDWTNAGVEITLNSNDYPSDINAYFEVGLSIIGGQAWARLVNKTTGAIMNITELSHSTSTTTFKTSPAFKLHKGTNTYALEIKTSSGETANFSGARIVLDK